MAITDISFPHPVLGNGDDISIGNISPQVSYEISDEVVNLTLSGLASGHHRVDQMVEDGDAAWHVRLQCSRTYMRESFATNSQRLDLRLKGEDYEGFVDVEISVVAQKEIVDYRPEGIHEDYEDETFLLRSGDVIGVGPTFRFLVDKVYDPLKAPLSSLVRITEGEDRDGPFTVSYDDDLIVVSLSKSDWHEYSGVRDRVPTVVHSAIVLPALAEAIRRIDKHTDTLWGGRLKDLLEAKNIDQSAPLAAAQEVLASPVSRTFNEVNATLDQGGA